MHYKHASEGRTAFFLLLTVAAMLFAAACQKEVHIDLGSTPPQLVVQGVIENNVPPYVILTNTIGFFSNVNLGTLQNTFVHGATIQVSDGVKTISLKEYALDTGMLAKYYIYFPDTTIPGNILFGELGKSYTLTVNYNNKTYTAVTKIPYPKGVDTLWFGPPIFKRNTTPPNALEMFGNYSDPDTLGNYVRYFTRRNNDIFYPGGVFSDELVNGKKVTNIDLFAGYNDSINVNVDSVTYFYPGDSVTLKWSEIDKGVYDFWNTFQFSVQSTGNPFSSPINIKSNISNGALGVWAGYGSIYTTVVAH